MFDKKMSKAFTNMFIYMGVVIEDWQGNELKISLPEHAFHGLTPEQVANHMKVVMKKAQPDVDVKILWRVRKGENFTEKDGKLRMVMLNI